MQKADVRISHRLVVGAPEGTAVFVPSFVVDEYFIPFGILDHTVGFLLLILVADSSEFCTFGFALGLPGEMGQTMAASIHDKECFDCKGGGKC